MSNLYDALSKCKLKAAALCLVYPYANNFIAKSRNVAAVTDLHEERFINLKYHDLIKECTKVSIEISDEDAEMIEKDTRKQSKCDSFFKHRAGRIGASNCKSVCHTNPAQPAQSIIKTICYPQIFKFTSAATEFGQKHEQMAITEFESKMALKHKNYTTTTCGMFINKEFPWLHATPDFLSSCDCCGSGCGEVKCPYSMEGVNFENYLSKTSSCLEKNWWGNYEGLSMTKIDSTNFGSCHSNSFN